MSGEMIGVYVTLGMFAFYVAMANYAPRWPRVVAVTLLWPVVLAAMVVIGAVQLLRDAMRAPSRQTAVSGTDPEKKPAP